MLCDVPNVMGMKGLGVWSRSVGESVKLIPHSRRHFGQVLHGSATSTHAIRTAIQRSNAPLKELAAQYGLNQKTVAKWRRRAFVHDAPMGPKASCSTVLSAEEEAIVTAFREHTLLPLDDCLYALPVTILGELDHTGIRAGQARRNCKLRPQAEGRLRPDAAWPLPHA